MSGSLSPQGIVLAGIIPDRPDRLERALRLLAEVPEQAEAFKEIDAFLWESILAYHSAYRSLLPIGFLADRLRKGRESGEMADEVVSRVADAWKLYRDEVVPDDRFEWAVTSLYESWRDERAAAAIARAAEILRGAVALPFHDPRTGRTESRRYAGYADMRERLSLEWAPLDKMGGAVAPEMNLRTAYAEMMADVGSAETGTRAHFSTGIDVLDAATAGGPATGQLWFIAGYSGDGKTTFAAGVLARQAILAGLNVVYFTGETLLEDVRRLLVCRHTCDPRFGLARGVDRNAVLTGSLTEDQMAVYQQAAADLTSGPYGNLLIRQMPLRNHFEDIVSTLERVEAQWPVDVLVVDSIDMIRANVRGFSYREQLSESIEAFAALAPAYAGGRGLIVISPFQVNRSSYDNALANSGRYELSALAETAMAERRAGVVLSLLRLPDMPSQIRAQLLKNRRGPKAEFQLNIEDGSGYMGPSTGGAQTMDTAAMMM